ncbi:MAG: tetraacyldisaccharide 4'-kinase [Alphaproteobacteria bacterium PA2]|nr:MAG: tetraacyldisaccharide 4'-kinase [Alphaproteobacteria bacterium PA2]
MKLPTPKWWYVRSGAPAPVTRALLTPISWIWAWTTARRIARTIPIDPGAPVICVGNLTAGGTGKTPVVRELLTLLRARGVAAHGLSRGYGGAEKGPLQVDLSRHTAADVGDEPLMMAADGPMWISADRVAGAKAAVAAGARVLVMDDGHQNPTLQKALSLVVVDGETRDGEWPLGDGSVFPAGPLREPLATGLARADAVVLVLPQDLPSPDPELLAMFQGKPVLVVRITPVEPPPPGPQLGFAGIGKPWKFERALKAAGCDLVEFANFPDHADYSEDMLTRLSDMAAHRGAGLITTEKDWVRLPPAWRERIRAWPIRASFEAPADLETLLSGLGL